MSDPTASSRRPKVLICHQGCIPIYRKPFFERLNSDSDIDFVVVHGRAPRGSDLIEATPPFEFPNIRIENREWRIGRTVFIWQPVLSRILRGEFQGAVIGDEIKYLSSVALALVLYLYRRPVLLWGFGFHQYDQPRKGQAGRAVAAATALLKRLIYRIAAGYLAYTEGGARALCDLPHPPKRIVVLKNTVDTAREAGFRATVNDQSLAAICAELGVRLESTKLLYFGRFVPTKHVDLLVDYARRCQVTGRTVDVILFGQGVEEDRLKALASGLTNVIMHRHDDMNLARALRVSLAVVIPGYVGLAVTHGFAHGVPILTRLRQLHSPEVEYIEDGRNGLMLPEEPELFFAALDRFVDDPALQTRLAQGAEETAATIDMDHMVATFRGLVADCLGAPARQFQAKTR